MNPPEGAVAHLFPTSPLPVAVVVVPVPRNHILMARPSTADVGHGLEYGLGLLSAEAYPADDEINLELLGEISQENQFDQRNPNETLAARLLQDSQFSVYLDTMRIALSIAGVPKAFGWPRRLWMKIGVWFLLFCNVLAAIHSLAHALVWLFPSYGMYDPLIYLSHTLMCFQPLFAIGFGIKLASRSHVPLLRVLAKLSTIGLVASKKCRYRIRHRLSQIAIVLSIAGLPLFVFLSVNLIWYAEHSYFSFMPPWFAAYSNWTSWILPYHFVVTNLSLLYCHLCVSTICSEQLFAFGRALRADSESQSRAENSIRGRGSQSGSESQPQGRSSRSGTGVCCADGGFIIAAPRIHQQLMSAVSDLLGEFQTLVLVELGFSLLIIVCLATSLLTGQIDMATARQSIVIDFYGFLITGLTFGLSYIMGGLGGFALLSNGSQSIVLQSCELFALEVAPEKGQPKDEAKVSAQRDLMLYLRQSYGAKGVEMFGVPMTAGTIVRFGSLMATVLVATLQKMAK